MRLTSIDIDNFRCYKHCHVDFDDRLTVIIGSNGSGKTAILEAARIAIGTFSAAMGVLNKGYDSIQNNDVRNEYHEVGSVIDVQPQYPSRITASGIIFGRHMDWECVRESRVSRTLYAGSRKMAFLAHDVLLHLRDPKGNVVLPLVSYYGTGRLWNPLSVKRVAYTRRNSRTDAYVDALNGAISGSLLQRWFYNMSIMRFERDADYPEFRAVRKAMETCFRKISKKKDAFVYYNRFSQEIEFIYSEARKDVRVPLRQMSDGYRCTISLVADIAYRMAVLNPQLLDDVIDSTPGVVLIDEIDQHLHPSWQQDILGILQDIFRRIQFVVTTHAPSVISSVKAQNIRVLTERGVTTIPAETYGRDANAVLESIMEADRRPRNVKILFGKFHSAIDDKKYKQAEMYLDRIANLIGENDPELASARVELDLEMNLQ